MENSRHCTAANDLLLVGSLKTSSCLCLCDVKREQYNIQVAVGISKSDCPSFSLHKALLLPLYNHIYFFFPLLLQSLRANTTRDRRIKGIQYFFAPPLKEELLGMSHIFFWQVGHQTSSIFFQGTEHQKKEVHTILSILLPFKSFTSS